MSSPPSCDACQASNSSCVLQAVKAASTVSILALVVAISLLSIIPTDTPSDTLFYIMEFVDCVGGRCPRGGRSSHQPVHWQQRAEKRYMYKEKEKVDIIGGLRVRDGGCLCLTDITVKNPSGRCLRGAAGAEKKKVK